MHLFTKGIWNFFNWNRFNVSLQPDLESKAWFSYAADLPATKPPVLPGILFRHMGTLCRRQQDLSEVFAASMPDKLNSSQLRRHDGGTETGMISVAGDFCSHIGTVSQAVPATMPQVGRRHMRTRLYLSLWGWNPCYILARTIDFYYLN